MYYLQQHQSYVLTKQVALRQWLASMLSMWVTNAPWRATWSFGFLLPFLKWKPPKWVIFKLSFSHLVMEILLSTGDILLPRAIRLKGLLSLVHLIVTWSDVNPKTHPVCRCIDVIPWGMEGKKYIKYNHMKNPLFAQNICCSVVAKST